MFLNCSTCFGRHTAHHKELKTVIAVSGFTSQRQPKTYVKPETTITVFELLMMGGVSAETCWAIKKHWNNKFYYTVTSCWFFLWISYNDAQIREHQVHSAKVARVFTIMMSGASPETCWAIKKHWNNKFYYTVVSCWFFLWILQNGFYSRGRES